MRSFEQNKGKQNVLDTILKRKGDWIGHIISSKEKGKEERNVVKKQGREEEERS